MIKIIEFAFYAFGIALIFISISTTKENNRSYDNKFDFVLTYIRDSNTDALCRSYFYACISIINRIYTGKYFVYKVYIYTCVVFIATLSFIGGDAIFNKLNAYDHNDNEIWLIYFLIVAPFNSVINYASLYITSHIMGIASTEKSYARIMLLVLADIIACFALFYAPTVFEVFFEELIGDPNPGVWWTITKMTRVAIDFVQGNQITEIDLFTIALSISVLIPTLFYIIYALFLFVIKLAHAALPKYIDAFIDSVKKSDRGYIAAMGTVLIFMSDFVAKIF